MLVYTIVSEDGEHTLTIKVVGGDIIITSATLGSFEIDHENIGVFREGYKQFLSNLETIKDQDNE